MIAVCGASGNIGKRVVAALRQEGAGVRALVRTPQSGEKGLEFVPVDLTKRESVISSLTGVGKVFLLTPIGSGQMDMERNVIQAAAVKGVRQIVKLSAMGAAEQSPIKFARIHGWAEEAIKVSGCSWTFIRPNMFMQNLFWYKGALQAGALPLPLGTAPVSHVDGYDVAAVATHALLNDRHIGKIYTVTGPEALTGAQVAAALSAVAKGTVNYRPISSSEFREYLKGTGETDMVVEAEVELFKYWSQGNGSEVTSVVSEVTGRKATSLHEFAIREKERLL